MELLPVAAILDIAAMILSAVSFCRCWVNLRLLFCFKYVWDASCGEDSAYLPVAYCHFIKVRGRLGWEYSRRGENLV